MKSEQIWVDIDFKDVQIGDTIKPIKPDYIESFIVETVNFTDIER